DVVGEPDRKIIEQIEIRNGEKEEQEVARDEGGFVARNRQLDQEVDQEVDADEELQPEVHRPLKKRIVGKALHADADHQNDGHQQAEDVQDTHDPLFAAQMPLHGGWLVHAVQNPKWWKKAGSSAVATGEAARPARKVARLWPSSAS